MTVQLEPLAMKETKDAHSVLEDTTAQLVPQTVQYVQQEKVVVEIHLQTVLLELTVKKEKAFVVRVFLVTIVTLVLGYVPSAQLGRTAQIQL